jgi:predicted kinase
MEPPRRLLIQMSGAPGSGKSTLASLLSRDLNGIVVDHDLIRSFFLSSSIPFTQSAQLSYRFQWILAEDMLKQQRSVIIDSTCNYDETLDQGMALAEKFGVEYKYVECRVDDVDVLDRRLKGRVPMRSQRTDVCSPPRDLNAAGSEADEREKFKRWIDHPCRPESGAIFVNSTKSPEECLACILAEIVPSTDAQSADGATSKSVGSRSRIKVHLAPCS